MLCRHPQTTSVATGKSQFFIKEYLASWRGLKVTRNKCYQRLCGCVCGWYVMRVCCLVACLVDRDANVRQPRRVICQSQRVGPSVLTSDISSFPRNNSEFGSAPMPMMTERAGTWICVACVLEMGVRPGRESTSVDSDLTLKAEGGGRTHVWRSCFACL